MPGLLATEELVQKIKTFEYQCGDWYRSFGRMLTLNLCKFCPGTNERLDNENELTLCQMVGTKF